ncbi:MAG: thiol:disulfide interchange protein [Bacteroidetes bacterium]|nr:MAG: thiol:disulfide interchange protein [Bacteroidota bacterium]
MFSLTKVAKSMACIAVLSLAVSTQASAQQPVTPAPSEPQPTWSTKVIKLADGEAEVQFIADIPAGWHIYSVSMPGTNGPLPTNITITPGSTAQPVGNVSESKPKTVYENTFKTTVSYFENQAIFKQKIKYTEGQPQKVNATVEFMMMGNAGQCQAPSELDIIVPIQ